MSLDFHLSVVQPCDVYDANITHNLSRMAREAGVYDCLWEPTESGFTTASQIIAPLEKGIAAMEAEPERFRPLDARNGWGTYEQFLPWLRNVLAACREHPDATIRVHR